MEGLQELGIDGRKSQNVGCAEPSGPGSLGGRVRWLGGGEEEHEYKFKAFSQCLQCPDLSVNVSFY